MQKQIQKRKSKARALPFKTIANLRWLSHSLNPAFATCFYYAKQ
jgi:hypothetical protein